VAGNGLSGGLAISSASIDHSCGRTGLEHPPGPSTERATAADLDALRGNLRAALNDSTPTRVKGVLQTMIDTIRVDARDQIEPTLRVPAVRIDYGYMGETARRANHPLVMAPAFGID
jgi:hypothetical protein